MEYFFTVNLSKKKVSKDIFLINLLKDIFCQPCFIVVLGYYYI